MSIYRAPGSRLPLTLEGHAEGDEVEAAVLVGRDGERFVIEDGIADLVWPRALHDHDRHVRSFYDGRADVYDRYLPLTFRTFGDDEDTVRAGMVALLRLESGARVLEVGAGTGRDSEVIARALGPAGELHCQDLSAGMLAVNRDRLRAAGHEAEYSLGNASHLPFADASFDAVFQFGGVGEFSDIPGFYREAVRVTRPGGRIVTGDESMPPWLRDTAFSRILTLTNPQFAAPLPLEHLPVEAREVGLRWVIGGTFYVIDFTVGSGEPHADFDFEIPGVRGGTYRTRFEGQLEGVTPETKRLAMVARERLGVSMHDWLDGVIRREAESVLNDRKSGP